MKGVEVIAALKRMTKTIVLRELLTEYPVEIKHLLDLLNFSLFSRDSFAN